MDPDRDAPEPERKAVGGHPEDRLDDHPDSALERHPAGDPQDGADDFPDDYPGDEASDDPGGDGSPNDYRHTGLPPKLEAWRRRSATGAILTGFGLGLQQVFEKEREQPSIVMQTSGRPPRDLPVDAEVEHGRPRQSVVNIRPWLLGESAGRPDGQGGAPKDDSVDAGDGRQGPEDDR